ncbi:MAG: trans-sulfuration enzyme family protein [Bacteroidota bacterium]
MSPFPKPDWSSILNELGEARDDYFGAVSPPIIQSSNFAFRTVEDLRIAFADEMGGYLYSRGLNPTVDILRKKLAALDGAEDALVFNSGAAAIYAGVLANVKSGDHIVSVKAPYTWVQRLFDVILPRFGITTTYISGKTIQEWEAATQSNTTFFYLESPNSWDYSLQPLADVSTLAKSNGIITLIDNSYCTPFYQRPIELGIDLVMQTATKYISGHSDTLGGVLSGSANHIRKIFESEYLNIGSGIQPFNAWLLIRGLRTLPIRLERIERSTGAVVAYLKKHPKVEQLIFPLDPAFPQYELALSQMRGACGLFTIVLRDRTLSCITRFCESLKHFLMAVSWGGHESLIIPKCAGMEPEKFDPEQLEHRYIRVYVGLEEPEHLIADLDQALKAL